MSELFSLDRDYLWVLLSVTWIGFQVMMTGFIGVGPTRQKTFNKEFLDKHFGEEHKKMTGELFPKKAGGYPDTGNGIYSHKLPYESWYKFNIAQRIHLNYVELVATIIIFTLVSGLFFPKFSAALGFLYIVSRQLYYFGYKSKGGAGNPIRIGGAIVGDLVLLVLFITANIGIFKNI